MKKFLIALLFLSAIVLSACAPLKPLPDREGWSPSEASVSETTQPTKKAVAKTVKVTKSQEQAIKAAEQYLEFKSFSKKGLIRQLSSNAGGGFTEKDSTYAVNHIKVDWNQQAARSAKEYLELMPFSRSGLIRQLTSPAGDQYTKKQAEYGVKKAGL